jgi:hypothetical protein
LGGVGMNVCALIEPKSVTPGRSNVIFIAFYRLLYDAVPARRPADIMRLLPRHCN